MERPAITTTSRYRSTTIGARSTTSSMAGMGLVLLFFFPEHFLPVPLDLGDRRFQLNRGLDCAVHLEDACLLVRDLLMQSLGEAGRIPRDEQSADEEPPGK